MLLTNFSVDAAESRAIILSLSGPALTGEEEALFRELNPLGFILFSRNIETPSQLRALCDSLHAVVGRQCPILIDQEGGRVARLKPPLWPGYPAARTFGMMDSARPDRCDDALAYRTAGIAKDLRAAGITVNCDPVLDIAYPETHDVIGDRAYSAEAECVSKLGEAVCRTYLRNGITPIIKHIPGHGRATADSHLELPTVTADYQTLVSRDCVPFRDIANSAIGPLVWAMSAHILYTAFDPDRPLTLSASAIKDIIRTDIGFDGILISDDVSMKALDPYGDLPDRCVKSLEAGCDLALYCAGHFNEMKAIAADIPVIRPDSYARLIRAAQLPKDPV